MKGEIVGFIQLVQSRFRSFRVLQLASLLFLANKTEPIMGASCTPESRFVRGATSHVVVVSFFLVES